MAADYAAIRKVAERLAERLRAGTWVRVTSPAGSDITVNRGGREPRGWQTAIVREPGEISALPGGEVSFPPLEGTANGAIVFERVVTDLGAIGEPIRITVRDGEAVAIDGGRDAARLRALVDGVPGARNIGELGIGLNPAARVERRHHRDQEAGGNGSLRPRRQRGRIRWRGGVSDPPRRHALRRHGQHRRRRRRPGRPGTRLSAGAGSASDAIRDRIRALEGSGMRTFADPERARMGAHGGNLDLGRRRAPLSRPVRRLRGRHRRLLPSRA